MRESEIEDYFVQRIKDIGGEVRKVKWIGRRGAPDRVAMLPDTPGIGGWARTIWVEFKAPGEKAKPHQIREHERMRRMGQIVVVIDSLEGVDRLMGEVA